MNKPQVNYTQIQSLCQKRIKKSNQFLTVKHSEACISMPTHVMQQVQAVTRPCNTYLSTGRIENSNLVHLDIWD